MSVIDAYLAKLKPSQREALDRVRTIAKTVAPDAEETISYGMPCLKYNGKYLIYFDAFKNHMSVFPGTIHFTEENPIDEKIVKDIVRTRLQVITNHEVTVKKIKKRYRHYRRST